MGVFFSWKRENERKTEEYVISSFSTRKDSEFGYVYVLESIRKQEDDSSR
jgi:hypothetical protein